MGVAGQPSGDGAAGATEAIFAIRSIVDRFVPASLGATPTDPTLAISVATSAREGAIRHVLSNSLAFGGNNASLLFGVTP